MSERRWILSDFDYHLPEELIAQTPTAERGASRLLVLDRGGRDGEIPLVGAQHAAHLRGEDPAVMQDLHFADLCSLISPGDLLVRNTSKVRHARLLGTRAGGGEAEVLLLHPAKDGQWLAMVRPGRALKPGRLVQLPDGIAIEVVAVDDEGFRLVRFNGGTAEEAIQRHGQLPLPPYITRTATREDELRYQTVYSDVPGSVAAPTAGLHFTVELLDRLAGMGAEIVSLDLEVGPGTFRPVESDDPTAHPMHRERFDIPAATAAAIAAAKQRGSRVWAVGTTVVRALESAAGDDGTVTPGRSETRLMITPGYRFRAVDALLTNFHLPRTTLLMLVAAFAGYEQMMAAYRHAVASGYRFYSYGDAMCVR